MLALAQAVRIEFAGSAIGISVLSRGLTLASIAEMMRRHTPVSDEATFTDMENAPGQSREPQDIANFTLDATLRDAFHIFTHSEHASTARAILRDTDAALQEKE